MRKNTHAVFITVAVIAVTLAPALWPAQAAAQSAEYVVGPRDVLAITVSNEPTLSGKFTVVSDGTFTYPLLGSVTVGGLSIRGVERELTSRLAKGYLEKPVVTVSLEQFGSQRVLIVGEVKQAGSYSLTGRTTVLEALLNAGATLPTAGSEVLVVRGGASRGPGALTAATATASASTNGSAKGSAGTGTDGNGAPGAAATASGVLHINLDALQRGDLSQNVDLQAGDMVFVPRADPPTPVYVMGLVRTPGSYQLPKGATVLQALAQAGGVTDQGSTKRVSIVRKQVGQPAPAELKASMHDFVLPGDTIVVRRRLF